jgi:hypothetical protein
MIYKDKKHIEMNGGYGFWNHDNFPEVCDDYDVTGLDMRKCFFSINDELIEYTPEVSIDGNQVTQEMLNSISEKLASIS